MSKRITMSSLNEGGEGFIIKINNCPCLKRLGDLGIIEGTKIRCVKKGKGIGAYYVKGCVIAVRDKDCEAILIETGEKNG